MRQSNAFLWGTAFLLFWILFDGWLCTDNALKQGSCLGKCPDASDGSLCDMCFCERISDGPIKEPVNTGSNIGFFIVGMLIMWHMTFLQPFRRNRLTEQPCYGILYGLVAIGIGGGSSAMHGSFTAIGQWLDMGTMFFWTGFVIAYNMARIFRLHVPVFTALFLVLSIASNVLQYKFGANNTFASLVAIAILLELIALFKRVEVVSWTTTQWMLWTVVIFLVGFGVWLPSRTGHAWCNPDSLWQGHAFWHMTSACAVGFCFIYAWKAPDRIPGHDVQSNSH